MNKFLHRWLGIIVAIFIILFAISGIILNHRSFFSSIDINRRFLPSNYQFQNWNLASVKSATAIGPDSLLIFGNIGIWLTDSTFKSFEPFQNGLPKGADNRRTSAILKTPQGSILAGTMSGLYAWQHDQWKNIELPVKETRITAVIHDQKHIWVLTRSGLIKLTEDNHKFSAQQIPLPHPDDFRRETSLFRALWVIHSGKILGLPGKLLIDFMGLVMIFLSISGMVWFVAPDLMKQLKNRLFLRKKIAKINRFSHKWHNHLGIWTAVFLFMLTLTGMFLRPPLLIPIVNKSFPALQNTILDHPNPWYDKLRDIQFDRFSGQFILSTADGFYHAMPDFTDSLRKIPFQPPVSVMGINVFEQPFDGLFITGSFSGIHQWIPSENIITDYITGMPFKPQRGMSNPFGSVPVAGYLNLPNKGEYLFDYNACIFALRQGTPTLEMPDILRSNSPMPLWNVALEIHPGRFYAIILGKYYILFIPLAGIFILTILVSGIVLWIRNSRRKKRCRTHLKRLHHPLKTHEL